MWRGIQPQETTLPNDIQAITGQRSSVRVSKPMRIREHHLIIKLSKIRIISLIPSENYPSSYFVEFKILSSVPRSNLISFDIILRILFY